MQRTQLKFELEAPIFLAEVLSLTPPAYPFVYQHLNLPPSFLNLVAEIVSHDCMCGMVESPVAKHRVLQQQRTWPRIALPAEGN